MRSRDHLTPRSAPVLTRHFHFYARRKRPLRATFSHLCIVLRCCSCFHRLSATFQILLERVQCACVRKTGRGRECVCAQCQDQTKHLPRDALLWCFKARLCDVSPGWLTGWLAAFSPVFASRSEKLAVINFPPSACRSVRAGRKSLGVMGG